jgi:hypothetical protein
MLLTLCKSFAFIAVFLMGVQLGCGTVLGAEPVKPAAANPSCKCDKGCDCLTTGICKCGKGCKCTCGCEKTGACFCGKPESVYAKAYARAMKTRQPLIVHVGGICPVSKDFALETSCVHCCVKEFAEVAKYAVVVGLPVGDTMVRVADLAYCADLDAVRAVLIATSPRKRGGFITPHDINTGTLSAPDMSLRPWIQFRRGSCPNGQCK